LLEFEARRGLTIVVQAAPSVCLGMIASKCPLLFSLSTFRFLIDSVSLTFAEKPFLDLIIRPFIRSEQFEYEETTAAVLQRFFLNDCYLFICFL
jgi:hypothetical protein